MRIAYLFNSSIPSGNPGSIQVAKTCEAIIRLSNKVKLIVPNTGLKKSMISFYGLRFSPDIIRIKYFKKFPLGLKYYLFSLFSVIYGINLNTELFITRNFFTLFLLNLFNQKVIIEIHHDLSTESRIVRFLFKNFDILNGKNILKIIAITKSVKNYLIKSLKVEGKKIDVIPSASSLNFKFKEFPNKNRYNIGYFGSLDESKGSKFIAKLSMIDKKNNYFIFGGSKKDLQKFQIKNNCKNINLNTSVPYGKIKIHLSKMDILLMPSNKKLLRSLGGVGNIAKYTSPLKLFDYMASGKLIIMSNLKVFKEIVKNNVDCIMLDNLNDVNWVKKINQIKKNHSQVNFLKKNAYLKSKKYTYLNRAKKILDLNYK